MRATGTDDPRIYGPGPGAYGVGILQLLEQRSWRSDDDLAAVYIAWSGYSYGRGGFGVPAEGAMRRRFAAIDVAVKNQDNREHDIFDSDDYLQDHGGMVATIRSLTGRDPKAWFGDSADPARPQVRSLAEEAARVVRTRVVNPQWIEAMQRHGYKGAFEMAATVDYLFGYDATAHVVDDWMYERVTDRLRRRPDGAEVLPGVEPVGAQGDRRTAPRSQRPRHVGRQRGAPGHAARRGARGRGMGGGAVTALPFSAVVGLEDVKLALVLAAAQPRLGGVLLRGQKGSAKTTLARGLATLLPDGAPFVELPLGATEDRVLGSIDVAELPRHRHPPGPRRAAGRR